MNCASPLPVFSQCQVRKNIFFFFSRNATLQQACHTPRFFKHSVQSRAARYHLTSHHLSFSTWPNILSWSLIQRYLRWHNHHIKVAFSSCFRIALLSNHLGAPASLVTGLPLHQYFTAVVLYFILNYYKSNNCLWNRGLVITMYLKKNTRGDDTYFQLIREGFIEFI